MEDMSARRYCSYRCSSGSETQQILMDSCVFIFDASNTDETHEFNFYPRVDHKIEPSTNVTVNIIGQLWEDGLLATGATLASVTLMLEDRDTPGVCYLISEPTIRTFDSLYVDLDITIIHCIKRFR